MHFWLLCFCMPCMVCSDACGCTQDTLERRLIYSIPWRSRHAKQKASPDHTYTISVAATAALPIFFDFLTYIDPHHEPVEEQHERIDIKVRVFTPATLLHRSAVVVISPPDWHRPAQDLHPHLAIVEAAAGAYQLCALLAGSQRRIVWHLRAGMISNGCSGGCRCASLSWVADELQDTIHVSCLGIHVFTAGWQLIALIIVIISCRQTDII